MALILVDEFEGDPKEFYEQVKEEVKKREIPAVKFKEKSEFRSKGWFSGSEVAPTLSVGDETSEVLVFAYQYGRSFHVSTRAYWQSIKMAQREREGKLLYLEEVRSGCFTENVNRAVRTALEDHLKKRKAPVPPTLNPKNVFYSRESQTGDAEE